jgi:polar amino acid transport system substrate-binding protein
MKPLIQTVIFAMVLFLTGTSFCETPPLHIFAEDEAGPWGQPDGAGCGNDIVAAAFKAAGVPVVLEIVPYSRAKKMVLSGKALACFGMAWEPELEGKVVFADLPLYTNAAVIFQSVHNPLPDIHAACFPKGAKIGTVLGYEYPAGVRNLILNGKFTPVPTMSEQTNLKVLASSGRLDAVVCMVDELKSASYLISQAGVTGKVNQAFVMDRSGTYLGFAINHPQKESALKKFNEGMAAIKRNGTYDAIINKWKKRILQCGK